MTITPGGVPGRTRTAQECRQWTFATLTEICVRGPEGGQVGIEPGGLAWHAEELRDVTGCLFDLLLNFAGEMKAAHGTDFLGYLQRMAARDVLGPDEPTADWDITS